jgi:hypothetical protein
MRKLQLAAVALLCAAAGIAASTEKTIPMPGRDQSVKVGFAAEGGRIESVRIQHYPDADDVEKAKTKDLNDKQLTFWNFSVSNRNLDKKLRMRIGVEVIGKDGSTVGRGDKSDTVDAGKLDDNIRVWIRMRTLDVVSARKAKLTLSIEPK